MKKYLLFLLIAGLSMIGCDTPDEKYTSEMTITLTIASVKPLADESTYNWLQGWPAYIYKENTAWSVWYSFEPIEGFDQVYEEGYEYVISVQRFTLADPPMDTSMYEYKLKEVISKTQKNSEGIPPSYLPL